MDPDPDLSCEPPSGSVFPIGTTTVECTARDASGNTSQASFDGQQSAARSRPVEGLRRSGSDPFPAPDDFEVFVRSKEDPDEATSAGPPREAASLTSRGKPRASPSREWRIRRFRTAPRDSETTPALLSLDLVRRQRRRGHARSNIELGSMPSPPASSRPPPTAKGASVSRATSTSTTLPVMPSFKRPVQERQLRRTTAPPFQEPRRLRQLLHRRPPGPASSASSFEPRTALPRSEPALRNPDTKLSTPGVRQLRWERSDALAPLPRRDTRRAMSQGTWMLSRRVLAHWEALPRRYRADRS